MGDNVIGMVIERHSDNLILDIGGPFPAVLSSLAFEGATRRNRPKLGEGDLVYARVTLAHKDVDTELSCTEISGKVRSKITGMSRYMSKANSALGIRAVPVLRCGQINLLAGMRLHETSMWVA